MKALLERVKLTGLVALMACCLAFSAVAGDADDGDDGVQAQTSTGSCSATCTQKYQLCIAGGGSIGDCTANYNNCTANCASTTD